MSSFVVDSSVAVKWFLSDEEHAEKAATLLYGSHDLHTLDWMTVEVLNAMCKHARRGSIPYTEVEGIAASLKQVPFTFASATDLVEPAIGLARQLHATLYDSLFLLHALNLQHPLVTADLAFCNTAERSGFGGYIVWVGKL